MGIARFLSGMLGRRGKKTDAAPAMPTLVDQINKSMGQLVLKADSLNESWEDERSALRQIADDVKGFVPEGDIMSAKFEQEILGKITQVSSACDGVISGKQDTNLAALLQSLQSSVKQRAAMKS